MTKLESQAPLYDIIIDLIRYDQDMARAKIPYDELRITLRKMFPSPTYRTVRLHGESRNRGYGEKRTPTTIYGRGTGNYARIGYRCWVTTERIDSVTQDFNGFWVQESRWVMVEYNLNAEF